MGLYKHKESAKISEVEFQDPLISSENKNEEDGILSDTNMESYNTINPK